MAVFASAIAPLALLTRASYRFLIGMCRWFPSKGQGIRPFPSQWIHPASPSIPAFLDRIAHDAEPGCRSFLQPQRRSRGEKRRAQRECRPVLRTCPHWWMRSCQQTCPCWTTARMMVRRERGLQPSGQRTCDASRVAPAGRSGRLIGVPAASPISELIVVRYPPSASRRPIDPCAGTAPRPQTPDAGSTRACPRS